MVLPNTHILIVCELYLIVTRGSQPLLNVGQIAHVLIGDDTKTA